MGTPSATNPRCSGGRSHATRRRPGRRCSGELAHRPHCKRASCQGWQQRQRPVRPDLFGDDLKKMLRPRRRRDHVIRGRPETRAASHVVATMRSPRQGSRAGQARTGPALTGLLARCPACGISCSPPSASHHKQVEVRAYMARTKGNKAGTVSRSLRRIASRLIVSYALRPSRELIEMTVVSGVELNSRAKHRRQAVCARIVPGYPGKRSRECGNHPGKLSGITPGINCGIVPGYPGKIREASRDQLRDFREPSREAFWDHSRMNSGIVPGHPGEARDHSRDLFGKLPVITPGSIPGLVPGTSCSARASLIPSVWGGS